MSKSNLFFVANYVLDDEGLCENFFWCVFANSRKEAIETAKGLTNKRVFGYEPKLSECKEIDPDSIRETGHLLLKESFSIIED